MDSRMRLPDRRAFLKASPLLLLPSLGTGREYTGQAAPAAVKSAVRLTILGDNSVNRPGVKSVWGFACLVESRGHTVLFDTGADPAVLKDNLAALKVDPSRIDAVVISHYHGDHTNGAPGLGKLPGPRVFIPRSFEDHPDVAARLQSAGLRLAPVSQPAPLYDGMTISAPLPFGGSIALPSGAAGQSFTDKGWEQCLTIETAAGLVIVAGCSHPGILAMLEEVKRRNNRPLHLVIGGFHLIGRPDSEVRKIATSMQAMGVEHVSATHCTGEAAAHVFRNVFGDRYVNAGVGAVLNLPGAGLQ
jgi:7,8-dihydropterin-6-yl-methyl-4-(beta-D-ribofuranosyl)aminobenzene 5'-phosphate synthase